MRLEPPYLLFLGDAADSLAAKTAEGIARWRSEWCAGQLRLPGCKADLGLPELSLEEGREAGARTLIVGVANRGGLLSARWLETLMRALDLGFHIAAGLHHRLNAIPQLREKAAAAGLELLDVRYAGGHFAVGSGRRRPGRRLLTVGTDCSVGKMFTALAIEREMKCRSMKADFRATGQTGIFISGAGIAVDAVVADFISGAVESLAPANDSDHWDIIEGQGSLFHASYAGVSLGLLHGAQAECLVLCHDPRRIHMRGLPDYALPGLKECVELNERLGRLTHPGCRVAGVSVNTAHLGEAAARHLLHSLEKALALPVVDAYRQGAGRLVEAL